VVLPDPFGPAIMRKRRTILKASQDGLGSVWGDFDQFSVFSDGNRKTGGESGLHGIAAGGGGEFLLLLAQFGPDDIVLGMLGLSHTGSADRKKDQAGCYGKAILERRSPCETA